MSGNESAAEPKRLNLTIRLTSGRKFAPNAPPAGITPDTTVGMFKAIIAATMTKRNRDATASTSEGGGDADAGVPMEPIPAARQRLVYKGRIMSDAAKTLGEYGVEDGGMIYLVKGSAPAGDGGGSPGAAAAPVGPSPMARLEAANASAATNANAAGAPPFNPFAPPGAGGAGAGQQADNPFASLMQMQSMFGGAGGAGGGTGGGMPDLAQMQEQLRNNPEMMAEMMNNPMIQSLMDNPQFM